MEDEANRDSLRGSSDSGKATQKAARRSARRYLAIQVGSGLLLALAVRLAYLMATGGPFPFGNGYWQYAMGALLGGAWLGYYLSDGRLRYCRCWLGVAAGQPLGLLAEGIQTGWAQIPWSRSPILLSVAVLVSIPIGGAIPAALGELAGSRARKAVLRLRPEGARTGAPTAPRFQFSLRALFVLLTLAAVYFAYLTYYGPARVQISYRVVLIERASADTILSTHAPSTADDAMYAWVILDDQELAGLLGADQKTAQTIRSGTRTVQMWPLQAHSDAYTAMRPVRILNPDGSHQDLPVAGGGGFAGFFGCRRAGMKVQLRIELDVNHASASPQAAAGQPISYESLHGRLFFQGTLPEKKHLVLFAPLGAETYYVLIFEGKRLQEDR